MRTTRGRERAHGRAGSASGSTAWRRRCASCCRRAACPRSMRRAAPSIDPAADAALVQGAGTHGAADHGAAARSALPHHINDPQFADAVVQAFRVAARRPQRRAGGRRGRPCRASNARSLVEKYRGMIARGEPIIGGGAGTGLSAKCEEAGGIDLIVIYNSGRYRMAGRGSLAGLMPYGDANQIVVEMGGRSAAGGEAHAGARRRLRHRSVPADGCVSRPAEGASAFPACRISRPSG